MRKQWKNQHQNTEMPGREAILRIPQFCIMYLAAIPKNISVTVNSTEERFMELSNVD